MWQMNGREEVTESSDDEYNGWRALSVVFLWIFVVFLCIGGRMRVVEKEKGGRVGFFGFSV